VTESWKGENSPWTFERFEPPQNLSLLRSEAFGREDLVGFVNRFGARVLQPAGECVVAGAALGARAEVCFLVRRCGSWTGSNLRCGDPGAPQCRNGIVVQVTSPMEWTKDEHDVCLR
jgi:hypothetical protein